MAQRFAVLVVQPPNYPHSSAFREVAESVAFALRALGQDVVLAHHPIAGRRAIVFGSNLLASYPLVLPADTILYNLEQIEPGSAWLTPALLDLYRRFEVWDYSSRNASRYGELGLQEPRVVPIGFVPELERIAPAPIEDIDVLFYGSMNARRAKVLADLRAAGLSVEVAFGVYGPARDRLIARSKVVLNIHYYEAKVFEIVRVSYLLANRRCVVSERGADPEEERAFEAGVAFADYSELVDTCVRLGRDPKMRAQIAAAGCSLIQRRDAGSALAVALGLCPSPEDTVTAPPVLAYREPGYPAFESLVRPEQQRILDWGCGDGATGAAWLAQGASEVVGVEANAAAAAQARTRLTAVYGLDGEGLPSLPYPPGYFDVITLNGPLDGWRDPVSLLRSLRPWLSDQGRIVGRLANVPHPLGCADAIQAPGSAGPGHANTLESLDRCRFALSLNLISDAGCEQYGLTEALVSEPLPTQQTAAALSGRVTDDPSLAPGEPFITEVLFAARPRVATGQRAVAILDPWRGSRPIRILLTPDLSDPNDPWGHALAAVVADLGQSSEFTVGVTLPRAMLGSPPDPFVSAAKRAQVDLLLTETPADGAGWERLFGGASIWLATSKRPELRRLASRVGVEVQELGGGV